MTTKRTPAVFLDRDATIIEDRGNLRSLSDVVIRPETVHALQRLQEKFPLFIVTRQPGFSGGRLSVGEVTRVNDYLVAELLRQGVAISGVYCCPHRKEESCVCIKPESSLLEKAARENGLELTHSFVIGDHPHDVAMAANAGATGIHVLTDQGKRHRAGISPCRTAVPGIREAVDYVFACCEMRRMESRQPGSLERAAALMRNGGIVAFPTETVYGLGAAVFDERAVARVFEVKRRPRFDPLIAHVGGPEELPLLVREMPAMARALIERFWPGPLTLVLPKAAQVPDLVTAGMDTVAVRMPRHPLALELISRVGMPVAAPSANPFGYTSPTTARHVWESLNDSVDMVLDGGPCAVGVESTILSLSSERPVLLRPGGVPVEDIERITGPVTQALSSVGQAEVIAPGMMPRHYSPRTPLTLIPEDGLLQPLAARKKTGLLTLQAVPDPERFACVEVLSGSGDLREAAAALFGAIHRLDERHLDLILARRVPEKGLGTAINDRLARAAGRKTCVEAEAH